MYSLALYQELNDLLGKTRVFSDPEQCLPFGMDDSRRQGNVDLVVFPHNHDEVVAIVQACNRYQTPIVARGAGTSSTGAAVPCNGGVVLSFEQCTQILEINPADRLMVVQPGINNAAIQQVAEQHGFFWAPDPGSSASCTIGGNLACNAAGPRAIKYGTTRDHVLGLRAVTGSGQSIRTGARTTKTVVGYDLTRLLIGSEGTLAIITEATLKLTVKPTAERTIRAFYQNSQAAAEAVVQIMSQSIQPCALELLDKKALSLLRSQTEFAIPASAQVMLLIKVDGMQQQIEYDCQALYQAAQHPLVCGIEIATDKQMAQAFWQARKKLSPLLRTLAPNKINEDIIVPISQLEQLLTQIENIAQQENILIVNFGHAGNGNIHVNLLFDEQNKRDADAANRALQQIFSLVIALGGSLSGEHGIGLAKKDFVPLELTDETIAVMRAIKQVFDPLNILNPGKIF